MLYVVAQSSIAPPPGTIPGPVIALGIGVLAVFVLLALFGRGKGGKK